MRKTAALHNLGCKVNAYELEAMQELLEGAGYEIVPFSERADVYVVNTCTVTSIADRKSRQMLHRAKKQNPDAIVVAAGCYAQTGTQVLLEDESVDIILGNDQKGKLLSVLEAFQGERREQVINISSVKEYEPLSIERTGEKSRAFVKVTDGCNQFCSYCLIPYARGRVRSRRVSEVAEEVRRLSCPEVVVTGIHVSSYGSDFKDGTNLLTLLLALREVPGVERIRLGSLEPRIITPEFIRGLQEIPQLCPHFHLSLQSGCDETLRRMNRHYSAKEYYESCLRLREALGDIALTTDVIVGFPGESEEEFAASYAFVEKVGFYETHIFKYSRREGTRAAAMGGQVAEEVKAARSDALLLLNRKRIRAYEERHIGETLSVLLEEECTENGETYLLGHSKEYIPVAVRRGTPGEIHTGRAAGFLKEHVMLLS